MFKPLIPHIHQIPITAKPNQSAQQPHLTQKGHQTHFEDKVPQLADGNVTPGSNNINRPKHQINKPRWMKDFLV